MLKVIYPSRINLTDGHELVMRLKCQFCTYSTFFPDMKPTVKMTDEDEREADESVLSAETSSSSGLGKEEKPSKYRLIDAAKYYIVEEDVSDDEDIDPKHYLTPSYQR